MKANTRIHSRGERGSVLIAALIFTLAVSALIAYIVSDSLTSYEVRQREESYAQGLAAAEYGAELVISEIANGLVLAADEHGRVNDFSTVTGDWILGVNDGQKTLFKVGGDVDPDQRRISGVFNTHDFRVRVRSVRMSYDENLVGSQNNQPLPDGWLRYPGEFNYGEDKAWQFRDTYEITATARHSGFSGGTLPTELQSQPVIQAVLNYEYKSPAGDIMNNATLNLENPRNMFAMTGVTKRPDFDAPVVGGEAQALRDVYSFQISGEDHELRRQHFEGIPLERITTPLRLTTDEERFFNATGGYWTNGYLTLNYISIDDTNPNDLALKYKDVQVTSKKSDGTSFQRTVRVPVANPSRPFTYVTPTTFYTEAQLEAIRNNPTTTANRITADRAMWARYNDSRTIDTYLLGGKPSRTVLYTEMPGTIINNSSNPAYPANFAVVTDTTTSSGKFNIVMGAFEDLPRVYINMSNGPSGADRVKPETWSQMFVGQYTNSARSTTIPATTGPILRTPSSASKIRPQTIQMMLNIDDQMLVREFEYEFVTGKDKKERVGFAYPASGTYYNLTHKTDGRVAIYTSKPTKDPDSKTVGSSSSNWTLTTTPWTAKWVGNYMWCAVNFQNSGNYFYMNEDGTVTVSSDVNSVSFTTKTKNTGYYCVPRQFFWQELVGYSLEKDYNTARFGEPALIKDGLGYKDNHSSGDNDGNTKRTYPRVQDDGVSYFPVGFDEAYQRNPRFDPTSEYYDSGNAGRWYLPLNSAGSTTSTYPSYLVDAWDSISIRQEDGTLKGFSSMDDFLFEKTFIQEEKGESAELVRPSLCLFIAYEDQVETQADYNYHDMIFSLWIAPQQDAKVTNINIGGNSKQWWERDERDGLTGDVAQLAVAVNKDYYAADASAEAMREFHRDLFHSGVIERGAGDDRLINNIWNMSKEDTGDTADFPRAIFKYEFKYNTGLLDTTDKMVKRFLDDGQTTFYYSKGDLVDYIQYRQDVKNDEAIDWYDSVAQDWNFPKVLANLAALNPGIDFAFIDKRWDMANRERGGINADNTDALQVNMSPLYMRELAGSIVGSAIQEMPVITTRGFEPYAENGTPTAKLQNLGFIAGEIRHDPSEPILDGIVPAATPVPIRSDELTFSEVMEDGTLRTGRAKGFFAANPEDAVAMCYVDFFSNDNEGREAKRIVQGTYGLKEERRSIGFHRAGPEKSNIDYHSQDRMEVVALGVTGFNPFRTTVNSPTFIASEQISSGSDSKFGIRGNYSADGGVAPSFVFDKPIDGAGALVVNGNLVIRDTFAYYGVLVVLGDLIIEPTLKREQFVFDSSGNPIDEYGNTVYKDESGNWWYAWHGIDPETGREYGSETDISYYYKDPKGAALRDQDGSVIMVTPMLQDVVRGELIYQGSLSVKGRIFTGSLNVDVLADGTLDDGSRSWTQGERPEVTSTRTHYGSVAGYWSAKAVEDSAGAFSNGRAKVDRVSWVHDDGINVESIWNNELDTRE